MLVVSCGLMVLLARVVERRITPFVNGIQPPLTSTGAAEAAPAPSPSLAAQPSAAGAMPHAADHD
jgi:hypothetical protein